MDKLVHLDQDYYSSVKRNELTSHENAWDILKCIGLSERSQSGKAPCHMNPSIQHSGKDETTKSVKNQWLPAVREREK